ncbi:MAG: dephospho-CoA kinase [Ginsengibacter sp.]
MLSIGLTGAIGSGKSTVARIFETLGIPVYYADNIAKRLMQENLKLVDKITDVFGNDAYNNGLLNRKFIADIVFSDEAKLKELNAIVHPATLADAELWINAQSSPYIIKEAALLFESGSNQMLDYIIGVQANTALSIQRVIQRDHVTEQDVLSRMQKQMDVKEKLSKCDFIIINDETKALIPQVLELHEHFLDIAAADF